MQGAGRCFSIKANTVSVQQAMPGTQALAQVAAAARPQVDVLQGCPPGLDDGMDGCQWGTSGCPVL